LKNALILNVVLAVFNLFPLPPLDGGCILVGILPKAIAAPVARLQPYGLVILIGLLIILPMLGAQLGIDLNFLSHLIATATGAIIDAIIHVSGNSSLPPSMSAFGGTAAIPLRAAYSRPAGRLIVSLVPSAGCARAEHHRFD
jgi:hypothetical protein